MKSAPSRETKRALPCILRRSVVVWRLFNASVYCGRGDRDDRRDRDGHDDRGSRDARDRRAVHKPPAARSKPIDCKSHAARGRRRRVPRAADSRQEQGSKPARAP